MDSVNKLVSDNLIQIIILIFLMGAFYAKVEVMQTKIEVLERRLDKKVKILSDHDKRINKLESK